MSQFEMKKNHIKLILILLTMAFVLQGLAWRNNTPRPLSPGQKGILRPLATLEKEAFKIIPEAGSGVTRDGFISAVAKWIQMSGLEDHIGREGVLDNGKIMFEGGFYNDGRAFNVAAAIVPNAGARSVTPYGTYSGGSDCFEGACALLFELRKKGYTAWLKGAPTGFWDRHIWVEVELTREGGEKEIIRVSTTPDIPHFDFKVSDENPDTVPEHQIQDEFKRLGSFAPIMGGDSETAFPMRFAVLDDNKKLILCAAVHVTGIRTHSGYMRLLAHIRCAIYILDGGNVESRAYEYPVFFDEIKIVQGDPVLQDRVRAKVGMDPDLAIKAANRHAVELLYKMILGMDAESAGNLQIQLATPKPKPGTFPKGAPSRDISSCI